MPEADKRKWVEIEIILPNHVAVKARTEEWLVAILEELPPEIRFRVVDRVMKRTVVVSTPGSYIMKAEPGIIGG
jgi:hypothetical protein